MRVRGDQCISYRRTNTAFGTASADDTGRDPAPPARAAAAAGGATTIASGGGAIR